MAERLKVVRPLAVQNIKSIVQVSYHDLSHRGATGLFGGGDGLPAEFILNGKKIPDVHFLILKEKDILEIFSQEAAGINSVKNFGRLEKNGDKNMKLADSNIEEYKREGLTIPDYKLKNVINQLSADIGELVEAFPEIPQNIWLAPTSSMRNVLLMVSTTDSWTYVPTRRFWTLLRVLLVQILFCGFGCFCKKPNVGLEVPWHQDGHFWPIRPLATCTVWIAVDDATKENGCMRYLPGSHKEKQLFKHHHSDLKSLF